jgi:hypothetical protein
MPAPILRGRAGRVGLVEHIFQFLPAWTMVDCFGVTAHVCGRCFRKLPDDPFDGRPGKLTPGVPKGTYCVFCNHKANPCD